ncbi:glycosyltransferase [Kaistella pullorum]|uniref:Glycosyltransferase n=1 Tax=Kaistella pullorum TaxID=2763074 RepID=A0ABR8WKI5_9FLAO|nr:glycosyltransferase [Kaistella pullorum]MBD8017567.1 glycosyltransferase [Kaistella pullorum]
MAKKKILIRIGSLRHGGAEKVLVTFLNNLPREKYEIDLLLNLYSGKYLGEVPVFVNVLYLNKGEMITTNRTQDLPRKVYRKVYQAFLKKFPKVLYKSILNGKQYDIEFAAIHGMRDDILNSPLKSSKKIVWIHNDLRKTHFHNYNDAEIRKFFGFDKIVVISEHIKNDFEKLARNDFERQKILRIYNPLDTEKVIASAGKPLEIAKSNVPTFVAIGTVFPQKGFDRLLRVQRRLLDEGFSFNVKIIGDGYDFEKIKKLKEDLNLGDYAEMTGFSNDPYPHLKAANFFVLSSRYEGFPTVLSEAVTLKKNIIATDVSGAREILENGNLGLIVENSEEGLYEGLKKAMQDHEIFLEYQQNLNNHVLPFSLENSVREIMDIIDGL